VIGRLEQRVEALSADDCAIVLRNLAWESDRSDAPRGASGWLDSWLTIREDAIARQGSYGRTVTQ
jgi:hypothetical protein